MAKTLAEILAGGSIQDSALDRQAALANSLLASGQRATNPLIAFLTGAVGNYQLADVTNQQRKKETELEAAAKAEAERAASQPQGLFEGTSMDAQVYNTLATADPSSKAYQIAYNIASQPKTQVDAQGNIVTVRPNMSAFQQALLNNPNVPNETIPTEMPAAPQTPVMPDAVTVPNLDQMPIDANEAMYDVPVGTILGGQTQPTVIDDNMETFNIGGSEITTVRGNRPSAPDKSKMKEMRAGSQTIMAELDKFEKAVKEADPRDFMFAATGGQTEGAQKLTGAWTTTALMSKGEALLNLGVLNGPDLQVIQGMLPNPASVTGAMASKEAYAQAIKNVKSLINDRIAAYESQFGEGKAAPKQDYKPASQMTAEEIRAELESLGQ